MYTLHYVHTIHCKQCILYNDRLPGHRDEVWSVVWSPIDEYLLASGSLDGSVRLWDIRRAGASACLHSFDQLQTRSTGEFI